MWNHVVIAISKSRIKTHMKCAKRLKVELVVISEYIFKEEMNK